MPDSCEGIEQCCAGAWFDYQPCCPKPEVSAGTDQETGELEITLAGQADNYDSVLWTQVSGETATITTPSSLVTEVTLPEAGSYRFKLTATNTCGSEEAFVDLIVTEGCFLFDVDYTEGTTATSGESASATVDPASFVLPDQIAISDSFYAESIGNGILDNPVTASTTGSSILLTNTSSIAIQVTINWQTTLLNFAQSLGSSVITAFMDVLQGGATVVFDKSENDNFDQVDGDSFVFEIPAGQSATIRYSTSVSIESGASDSNGQTRIDFDLEFIGADGEEGCVSP